MSETQLKVSEKITQNSAMDKMFAILLIMNPNMVNDKSEWASQLVYSSSSEKEEDEKLIWKQAVSYCLGKANAYYQYFIEKELLS